MKKLLLILSLFILNGCLYSFENGCIRPIIQTVSSNCYKNRKYFPYVAYFQKKGTIGHTDPTIRWNDVKSCGGINISLKDNTFKLKNERDSKGLFNPDAYNAFDQCMEKKGYIHFKYEDCGSQEPKWNKGKCNL
ncbi:hypothetical protein ACIRXL_06110 [Avibacterium paragallinarum]|uniref:hypothetical protein n=1 Tax=Avibacterium TaxID=292486 RepID=UPI003979F7D6